MLIFLLDCLLRAVIAAVVGAMMENDVSETCVAG